MANCPKCGGVIIQTTRGYFCNNCGTKLRLKDRTVEERNYQDVMHGRIYEAPISERPPVHEYRREIIAARIPVKRPVWDDLGSIDDMDELDDMDDISDVQHEEPEIPFRQRKERPRRRQEKYRPQKEENKITVKTLFYVAGFIAFMFMAMFFLANTILSVQKFNLEKQAYEQDIAEGQITIPAED